MRVYIVIDNASSAFLDLIRRLTKGWQNSQAKFSVLSIYDRRSVIRMDVASSRPDYLPRLSSAKTSKLSLLVKHHILAIDEAS